LERLVQGYSSMTSRVKIMYGSGLLRRAQQRLQRTGICLSLIDSLHDVVVARPLKRSVRRLL
jgi:hypothetical protein